MSRDDLLEAEPQIHVTTEAKLVYMANQIADFFASNPDADAAAAGVEEHIKKFWDPRMLRRMYAHFDATQGDGLRPLASRAIASLKAKQAA